ncbi:MAG TPA: EfeM/EfeO family lipoprotein [Lacisediminihabitans sp.]|uniref:EfeM/EfeO family lipoprotein n=1 Tax=Lacisediminihabitans sp. TaxID=2787631 RepID=UPI002ED97974
MHLTSLTTRQRLAAVFMVIALIMAAGVVATIVTRPPAVSGGTIRVESGTETCGQGWTGSRAGLLTFAVHNTTVASEEVYLQGARDGLVYGELEGLGAGATHNLSVILANGRYRFVCMPSDLSAQRGPIVTVSGARHVANATAGIQIITAVNLIDPSKQYHAWIEGQLPVLGADVRALDAAVASGDVSEARSAWLTAHLVYESLGAAYGTFGDLDGAINGTPTPGTTAITDPDLTGFHRIEAVLWGGSAIAEARPFSERLITDVTALQTSFATAQIPALDVGLRSHEILENAIQFELTGSTDAGSGTSIATIGANLVGTRQALAPLRSLLAGRYPDLDRTEQWLDRATALVDSYHRPDGSWTPITQLSTTQHEALDATLDETVELLAPIAAITDPRLAPQ